MAFDPNQPFEIEDNRGGFRPFDPNQPFEVLPDEPPPIAAGADEIPMPSRFQRHNGRLEGPGFRTRPEVMPDSGAPSRIGEAVVRGFEEGSQPLPPFVTPLMEGLGVYPPAGEQGTVLQRANRSVISPLAQVGEWALRGLGGAFRAGQAGVAEAGNQLGQPELGRDLAAIERQRKDRRVDMVFCEHGGDVRVMVVHTEHRDAALARHFGGKAAGV